MTDLINTLECPGEFDAMTMIRPGEPYFLLLGRDRLAPKLVQQWADANRKRALGERDEGTIGEDKLDRELRKATQAEAIGWAMKSFKAGDMAKRVAGEPTAKTYSGAEVPEETKRRDELQSARNRTAAALAVSVAEVKNIVGLLRAQAEHEEEPKAAELLDLANIAEDIVEDMDTLSVDVKPWRPIQPA